MRFRLRMRSDQHRQGDLDGACGHYSALHAVAAVIRDADAEALFGRLPALIRRHPAIGRALVEGSTTAQIVRMVRFFADEAAVGGGPRVVVRRPFTDRDTPTPKQWLRCIGEALDGGGVAIIGIAPGSDPQHLHATVVRGITQKSLLLIDSSGMRSIRLDGIGTRPGRAHVHLVLPQGTILVSPGAAAPAGRRTTRRGGRGRAGRRHRET